MLVTAALMCHAPIVIPAIAEARATMCQDTTRAMTVAANRLVASGMTRVLVISPHAPRHPHAYGWHPGPLRGDFARFGVPHVTGAFQQDPAGIAALAALTEIPLAPTKAEPLDHGALVPLWFLKEAGYKGVVTVLGFPWSVPQGQHGKLGAALRRALDALGEPWGLLASGDMSHALAPGAPGGYHPQAKRFDAAVVGLFGGGRFRDPAGLDPTLRELAREDVVDSLEVAKGVLGAGAQSDMLSYEAPFGVGYLVAMLKPGAA